MNARAEIKVQDVGVLADAVGTAADEIDCAVEVINDLLRLSLNQNAILRKAGVR